MFSERRELLKPAEFWKRYRKSVPFNSFHALRYHLARRHENGLVSGGAVVESPIGNLIDPGLFDLWLRGGNHGHVESARASA